MGRNLEEYHKQKAESWKAKAIARGLLLKLFRQIVGELRKGRDKWRARYEDSEARLRLAEEQIRELNLELKKKLKDRPPR